MKLTPFRVVITIDALLLIAATLYGFSVAEECSYGTPAAVMNFLAAFWLLPINFALAVVMGLIYAFGARSKPFARSWAGAFLFAFGLILLVNTPLCFAINMVLC